MDTIYSYRNKYMYFIVSRAGENPSSWLYCSGISMSRFLPITRGRHGLASNPSMRGLQLTDLQLCSQLNESGASSASLKGNPCDVLVPKEGDWYRQLRLISGIEEVAVRSLVNVCPLTLVGSIFQACRVADFSLPSATPPAEEFERFLDEVTTVYSRQAGWPTTASAKGFRK